jgi:FO synthase subunit 1
MEIVSYSRNVFLPVTNLCGNSCDYCGFRREPEKGAWFMLPEDVLWLAEKAKRMGCSEALITLGERPEVHREARERLDELGFGSMVEYIEYLCRKILEIGLLPHTNAGLLRWGELKQLRRYNGSMGLMLECIADLPAHRRSPGKNPMHRLQVIEAAGKLRIPFTTGLLVGIGESHEDRVKSLLAIRELHKRYGHIQEVIIQPFEPKPGTPMANYPRPAPSELLATVSAARSLLPDIGIQVPPNLVPDFSSFLHAGANDLGGISPLTPDFINPEHPWPSIAELRASIRRAGFIPRERLPIYPRYVKDERFMSKEVGKVVREVADEEGYRAP